MKYYGNDLHHYECVEFIEKRCRVVRNITDYAIEIFIFIKESDYCIAVIRCFFYNYKRDYDFRKKKNSIHIKSLGVEYQFNKNGIATFLMKEVILFAENKGYRHISVHPSAYTSVISQEDLEKFYNNFTFNTRWKKNKKIEFRIILD